MKRIAIVLAMVMLCLTLTSCGESKRTGAEDANMKLSAPGEFPITEEPLTYRIMVPTSNYIEDYNTNEFTLDYEKKTGIHIEWDVVIGDFEQKKNVVFASGTYPDAIMQGGISKAQQVSLGQNGVLMPLNDLIENDSKYFKEIMAQDDYIRKQLTALDGNIYGLPNLNYTYHMRYSNKMWVYKPWLDKLNISIPETTDEFYEMLKRFKNDDPNGNGIQDEIPFASQSGRGYNGIDIFLMNSFIYTPNTDGGEQSTADLVVEDGKIKFNAIADEFRDGLRYIKKLYNEGLVAQESLTMDRKKRTTLVETGDVPIVGVLPAMWPGMFTVSGAEKSFRQDFVAIPPLEGPNGQRQTPRRQDSATGSHSSITTQCKNPRALMHWVDWFYSEEGSLTMSYGRENEGWSYAKEGDIAINGEQAKWALSQSYGSMQNNAWMGVAPSYKSTELTLSQKVTSDDSSEVLLYETTRDLYEPYGKDCDVPDMFFELDTLSELAELKSNINGLVTQSISQFIAGQKDIENDWESFKSALENLGLQRYLDIYQKQYDLYIKN